MVFLTILIKYKILCMFEKENERKRERTDRQKFRV